ncbi:HamA C-terminal domain-containing protein [Halobellus salinisoli]|uniref:HamA C-terminal domain-containing protein n=1 Tax=Halobellus salinisoli TaxID=3108500 RepID=UPI003009A8CB
MSEAIEFSWSRHTVIDDSELLKYIYEVESWEGGTLKVDSYCIKPSAGTLNQSGFIQFLRNQLPRFVFSQSERDDRDWPGWDAPEFISEKEDDDNVGIVGELILFVLVDAILNMPMVCHKVSLKQDPVQAVKGSDGLFFGEFRGKDALAFGEAKFKTQRSTAITEAIEDTERFHGPEGHSKKGFELDVASRTLSEDLNEEEVRRIAETLSPETTQHREIHPVFIGYEDDNLAEFQMECDDEEELIERIATRVSDSDLKAYVKEKIEEEHPEMQKYWMIFFLFPIEDTTNFKSEWQNAVFNSPGGN